MEMVVLNESEPDTQEAVWVQRAHVVLHAQKNSLSIWWSAAQAVLEMEGFVFSSPQKHFLTWMPLILFWTNVNFYSPHHSKGFHSSTAHLMKNIHRNSLSLAPTNFVRQPPVQTQKETVSHCPQLFQQFSYVLVIFSPDWREGSHNILTILVFFSQVHVSSLILLFSFRKDWVRREDHTVSKAWMHHRVVQ